MADLERVAASNLDLTRDVLLDRDTGCAHWDGPVNSDGYPVQYRDGRQEVAHRVAFEAHYAKLPDWARLRRLCPTRRCVSPWHHALRAPRAVGRRLNYPAEELRGVRELLLAWRKRKGFAFGTDPSKLAALLFPATTAQGIAVTLGVSTVLVMAAYADLVVATERQTIRHASVRAPESPNRTLL